jgi:hypothetical protein
MGNLCVTGALAVFVALAAPGILSAREAADTEAPRSSGKGRDILDVRVPIPSYSKDVENNGCPLRGSATEAFTEPDADLKHVRFEDLIGEVVGGYSVRAVIEPPAAFLASLDSLEPEVRTLVLLDVLRNGLGRDGLHTFFYMKGGELAQPIRDALRASGLQREHALFTQAMALFGDEYPTDTPTRGKRYSYSSLDTPMNDFDRQMLEISAKFGSSEAFGRAMAGFVERAPALWQRIEAERSHLGEVARLRYLNQALMQRTATWGERDLVTRLAALPTAQRTLLVMNIFNAEFENGGVHQFFLNSSGTFAPEVHAAFVELGLDRQAAIFKKALSMFGAKFERDTAKRQARYFDKPEWNDWDNRLSAITDEFYALDGGATVVKIGDGAAIEGGPGIWAAMAVYARNNKLLPC